MAAAGNGVFEAGETVAVAPSCTNTDVSSLTVTGAATSFTGPVVPTYSIVDGTADYGTIPVAATADCATATGDCYSLGISNDPRPAAHWDATFNETLSDGTVEGWRIHVGNSFTDSNSSQFYKFIETVFHKGVTAGCGPGIYCPDNPVTRAQMAVFLLKSKHGKFYVPPSCPGVFVAVASPSALSVHMFAVAAEFATRIQVVSSTGNGDHVVVTVDIFPCALRITYIGPES